MAITIKTASALGFCFGVRRAIEMVEGAAVEKGHIDSLGSIVHNPVVADRLNSRGVSIVKGFDGVESKTVAITAHGAGREVYRRADGAKVEMVVATAPSVAAGERAAANLV